MNLVIHNQFSDLKYKKGTKYLYCRYTIYDKFKKLYVLNVRNRGKNVKSEYRSSIWFDLQTTKIKFNKSAIAKIFLRFQFLIL